MAWAMRSLAAAMLIAVATPAWAQPAEGPADAPVDAEPPAEEADPPPVPPEPVARPEPAVDPRELARQRFLRGLELFEEGALDAALAEFRASRATFATRVATRNVAVCLRALGRFDEALEVLEAIPAAFPEMPEDWKRMIARDTEEVARRVGTVEVVVNEAGAQVLLSGRARGQTPLGPLRLTSGSHPLRVIKPGFVDHQALVEVAGGEIKAVKVELQPLARAGTLRIAETDGRPARVVIDQAAVGDTPWSGRLAPGAHTVYLWGAGNLGTQPVSVQVNDGKATTLTLALEPLSSTLRIEPVPMDAEVVLDGIHLGRGTWEGAVRSGAHKVELRADGFLPMTLAPSVEPDSIRKVVAELERDPASPAWQKKNPPRVVFELAMGPALGASLGSDLSACDACSVGPTVGGRASARGGYQLGMGLGIFVDVGYLALTQSLRDRATTLVGVADPDGERDDGVVDDRLFLHGVMLGGALGYALGDLAPWGLHLRVGGGALIGEASDERSGRFTSAAGQSYAVGDYVEEESVTYVYVAPEVRFGYRVADRVELGAGLAALIGIGVKVPRWRDRFGVPSPSPFFGGFNGPGEEPQTAGHFIVAVPDVGLRVDF